MKKLLFILLVVPMLVNAQKMKLGKVTVAELSEKQHPTDTSAAAAVLFKKSDVSFIVNNEGYWNVVNETEVKIKVYKKEGYKYGDYEKLYYTGSHGDRLVFTDAATYNLVDGKVVKTRLKNEEEFTEKKNKNYDTRKLSFSNVAEGTIIEYKYIHTTYNTVKLQDFYFQEEIPVNFASYQLSSPESFDYNRTLGGFLVPERKDVLIEDPSLGQKSYRATFTLQNVPALKEESYVNNINNYRSKIIHELASQKKSSGEVEKYATNWEAVTKNIYDNDDFGRQLEKTNYYKEALVPILAGVTLPDEKMKKIFEFVQSKMTWDEYVGYSCNDGVAQAFSKNSGNAAEINLMLTAMLRHAGLKANPVILSTRSNGIAYFPSRTAFNYVVAAVESDKEIILLDATSKNTQPNILPTRALNWTGRIIRADGSSALVDLMPTKSSRELINVVATIDSQGMVSGTVKDIYADHNAYVFRELYSGGSIESHVEKLEKQFKGIEVSDHKLVNERDLAKPVDEIYGFSHNNLTESIGDRMYFSPMLFFARTENPFKQETREYPVDFGFPYQDKYVLSIKVPDGYAVESLPAPAFLKMNPNLGSFKYDITAKGNIVQLAVVYDINYAIVNNQYYEMLKSFFKEVVAKQTEKIVLKKV